VASLVERSPRRQVAPKDGFPLDEIALAKPLARNHMFHVYVLKSAKTGRRYIGSCENLDDRLRRHNAGDSKATRHGAPWTLIYTETFTTRREALEKERYYKTGAGRDKLDRLRATRLQN